MRKHQAYQLVFIVYMAMSEMDTSADALIFNDIPSHITLGPLPPFSVTEVLVAILLCSSQH